MKASMTQSLISLLVFSLLAGCTKRADNEYKLPVEETFRVNIQTEPPTIDWTKSTDTTSAVIQDNIMDGLVDYDYNDPELALEPALAEKWESNENASVWTFTIRKGVKWTDGQELTAQHFVDSWQRLLNGKTAAKYAYFLYPIKNAHKYYKGEIKDFSEVGVKVNDTGQLVVELKDPMAFFPYLTTHHSTYPIRKDIIEKHQESWTNPENIVTLGAYNLKIWDHDKAIVLERNEGYWGEKAKTKYVLAYMINDMSTAMNLFDSGKIDLQYTLPSNELQTLRQRPEFNAIGSLLTYYYGFNVRKPPFDDPKVRQAVNYAIDRKQVTKILGGGQIPLTSWIPAGMFGYEPERGISYNPERAKQLLKEAGYKDLSQFPKVEIGFNTNEDHQKIAENIQAQLKKNLGIFVELRNMEWKQYLMQLQNDPPSIYRIGWQADYPDPDNFMNLMTSYSANNYTGWGDSKYDRLIEKAASETSKEKRRQLYSQALAILTEEAVPVIPIYSGVDQLMLSKRVKNYPVNSLQRRIFKGVEVQ